MQPIEARRSEDTDAAGSVRVALRFVPGWPRVLIPSGMVAQIAVDPNVAPVPGCAGWLRGVAARRGVMVPVIDIGSACTGAASVAEREYIVILDPETTPVAVLTDSMPEVVSVEPDPYATASALPASLHPWIGAAQCAGSEVLHEFDVKGWLASIAGSINP